MTGAGGTRDASTTPTVLWHARRSGVVRTVVMLSTKLGISRAGIRAAGRA